MVRSAAKQRVSNHGAAPSFETPRCAAPQDEAEIGTSVGFLNDMAGTSPAMKTQVWMEEVYSAAADLPIAAFTRGMTSSAISCIERRPSFSSTQSMPA